MKKKTKKKTQHRQVDKKNGVNEAKKYCSVKNKKIENAEERNGDSYRTEKYVKVEKKF